MFDNGLESFFDYIDSSNEEKLTLFKRFMNGVDYMHSLGYCHRDISTENIVIMKNSDNKLIPKIIDFGVTWRIEDGNILKDDIKGKVEYIPPEAYRCDSNGYNPIAGDIWSCGIVLYMFMLGETPFPSVAIGDKHYKEYEKNYEKRTYLSNFSIDTNLIDLIYKMLNPKPLERPTAIQVMNHICLKDIKI